MEAVVYWFSDYEAGNEVLFLFDVQNGDEEYEKYWETVQTEGKDKFTFSGIKEGIEEALEEKVVVWTDENKVNGYFKNHPEDLKYTTYVFTMKSCKKSKLCRCL